ncbi:MAG: ATP synthase F1 subunit gamma [Gemmatimonadetes bacterium]|nr:ATP synthase F1 subunit gamma [Gemmatimonadota bacterium]
MANRRVLVKRRKAVRNIRKITRTMQLIATARFQSAFSRAVATRPYTEKLAELAANLTRTTGGGSAHPLLTSRDQVRRSALITITSARGLCGGYNSNVLRSTLTHLEELEGRGIETDVHMVGKKGINYFSFIGRELAEERTDIDDRPRFDQIEPMANELIGRFTAGEIDAVHVAYMRFVSTSRQRPEVIQLLPLKQESRTDGFAASTTSVQYEFSPDPAQILDELLPATVRVRLFQCFNDAAVSEQVARMVAMKAATDSAEEMITSLTRQYNRARQTHITMELLDIVGGANALA